MLHVLVFNQWHPRVRALDILLARADGSNLEDNDMPATCASPHVNVTFCAPRVEHYAGGENPPRELVKGAPYVSLDSAAPACFFFSSAREEGGD